MVVLSFRLRLYDSSSDDVLVNMVGQFGQHQTHNHLFPSDIIVEATVTCSRPRSTGNQPGPWLVWNFHNSADATPRLAQILGLGATTLEDLRITYHSVTADVATTEKEESMESMEIFVRGVREVHVVAGSSIEVASRVQQKMMATTNTAEDLMMWYDEIFGYVLRTFRQDERYGACVVGLAAQLINSPFELRIVRQSPVRAVQNQCWKLMHEIALMRLRTGTTMLPFEEELPEQEFDKTLLLLIQDSTLAFHYVGLDMTQAHYHRAYFFWQLALDGRRLFGKWNYSLIKRVMQDLHYARSFRESVHHEHCLGRFPDDGCPRSYTELMLDVERQAPIVDFDKKEVLYIDPEGRAWQGSKKVFDSWGGVSTVCGFLKDRFSRQTTPNMKQYEGEYRTRRLRLLDVRKAYGFPTEGEWSAFASPQR